MPETFISARAWGEVVYTRVASVAMKNYKDLFLEHDEDRFNSYLADVKSRPWETDYEAITRKYAEAGYADAVPQIVFWNLRDSRSVPVTAHQKLFKLFSKNMLKLFLEDEYILSPRAVMEKAIAGPEYQKLAVFD